jgi:hypothetical protein
MISQDIPAIPGQLRLTLSLGDLLARADEPHARWTDLPARPGSYLVLWPLGTPLEIRAEAGGEGEALRRRWQELTRHAPSDILYLGKADSLRQRIRQLARYGRGHAVNHQGGRNLWWIAGIDRAELLVLECPEGCQTGFANTALERFHTEHDDYPLANRQGPRGPERWWPDS